MIRWGVGGERAASITPVGSRDWGEWGGRRYLFCLFYIAVPQARNVSPHPPVHPRRGGWRSARFRGRLARARTGPFGMLVENNWLNSVVEGGTGSVVSQSMWERAGNWRRFLTFMVRASRPVREHKPRERGNPKHRCSEWSTFCMWSL